jgi:amidase
MSELHAQSATDLVRLIRGGEATRREVVEAHLDRVEAVNGEINAVVEVRDRDEALAEAEAADHAPAQARADLPLDGVPVVIKDHFDVTGMKHTEGVRAFADRRSPGNSVVVERLLEAGAIVVGKCNQPDFQIRWNTINDLYGITRNPRDLSLSAGGSSGGDAAAVAAGMAPLGLGLDYGGSIRVPATFCGIYGLRPSAGRVPYVQVLDASEGPPTMDTMSCVGPLARTLEDLWSAFRALAGPHPRDPLSVAVERPPTTSTPPAPLRVARLTDETGALIEPPVRAELDRVCDALAQAGYEVVDGAFPNARRAPELWAELIAPELLHTALPAWEGLIADSNRQHIEAMFGLLDPGPTLDAWIARWIERRGLAQQAGIWMDEHPLVVAPVAGMPTPGLDFDHYLSVEATQDLFDHMRDIVWVNLLGLPSIALPNGIQIVARRFREGEALAAAEAASAVLAPVQIAEPAGAAPEAHV